MPTREAPRKDKVERPSQSDRAPKKKPVPQPEGDGKRARPDDFDPLSRRDYEGHDGDAADPQRVGPGT